MKHNLSELDYLYVKGELFIAKTHLERAMAKDISGEARDKLKEQIDKTQAIMNLLEKMK